MPISNHLKYLRSKIGNTRLQLPGVAAIIHDELGKVLLQKRTDEDQWSLPAGAINLGETPAMAIVREVWEETSLKVKPIQILGVFSGNDFRYTYPNGDRVEYMVCLFKCEVIKGTKIMRGRDGETAYLQYFNPDCMPQLAMNYPHQIFSKDNFTATYFEWHQSYLENLV